MKIVTLGLMACIACSTGARAGLAAEPGAVLQHERSVAVPQIDTGDFDHFAVDLKHRKLYTSAQSAKTIEVFDLASGAHLRSAPLSINPHYIFYAPSVDRIMLADGGAKPNEPGQIKFIDPKAMRVTNALAVRYRPDSDLFDEKTATFYNVSANRGEPDSLLTIVDVDHQAIRATAAIPSTNVEGMAFDGPSHRLFLNMRDQHAIGVFDTETRQLVARWVIDGMTKNTPMAYDPDTHRLFVVGRDPGRLYVIDSQDGRLVSTVDCGNGGDDITYDPAGRRLFITTDQGFSVLARRDVDHFDVVQSDSQAGGKTSVYVPSLNTLFIGRAVAGAGASLVDVYRVAAPR